MSGPRIPLATYRLQLRKEFGFPDAEAVVGYLDALGVSDVYAAPLFQARPGSPHGYDVVDHGVLNPELGGEAAFRSFAAGLRERGLGLLLDVVPNHMCIDDPGNRWWQDVLENGPASPSAVHFDIDWRPPKEELADKVLLPFLGDQYGRVVDEGAIRVYYEAGAFAASVYDKRFPIAPRSWPMILEGIAARLRGRIGTEHPDVLELESILTALRNLPPRSETDPERLRERQREKEIVKKRLSALVESNPDARRSLDEELLSLNGRREDPRSFDRLEALLADQAYRLCYWRVAADEINYRRFFDINELAAIRVEDPQVFEAVHALVFDLVSRGEVTGLRIDHVDGLLDPEGYLARLREGLRRRAGGAGGEPYVVVEKILGRGEVLRPEWPVAGTTGYDFLAAAGGLFVDASRAGAFRTLYERLTGDDDDPIDLAYGCKRLIMQVSTASEIRVLAWRLDRISEQHRWSRDFTRESLRTGLREVIACFPVYRSYIRPGQARVGEEDRRLVERATAEAKRRNPAISPSLYDFIASVLLQQDPEGLSPEQRAERREFVQRFQQLSGPIMAKGLEDTAFYRHLPLASLNEVGAELGAFGLTLEAFHRFNRERGRAWPHALSATATHDTKRSEDVRARIHVLSEIPREWARAVRRWRDLNAGRRTPLAEGFEAPDPAVEYLIYQTLVGIWPHAGDDPSPLRDRLKAYLVKAMREAKLHTSWISPNGPYEEALGRFVDVILDAGVSGPFLDDFRAFRRPLAPFGAVNSLAQVVLKAASPGVPDFYQGTELWDDSLVDPDNRRPVDYVLRTRLLDELKSREAAEGPERLLADLVANWPDGRIKMYVTWKALALRKAAREAFEGGTYLPLYADAPLRRNVCAFVRRAGDRWILAAVPCLLAGLGRGAPLPPDPRLWGDAALRLPPGAPRRWRDAFSRAVHEVPAGGTPILPVKSLFRVCPVALLEGQAG